MATSVADLSVNISTNLASLYTGMQEATNLVGRSAAQMSGQMGAFNDRITAVGSALRGLAGIAVAGIGLNAFKSMISGAIEAQASLFDLAEKAGTTASKLSSLIPAARLSGTSIEQVAQASTKFSKQLVEIQGGTGKAAEAFKALGFNARDAARFLADPSQGIFEMSKRLKEFATDGNKVAAVQLVMGKGASELAAFMKELGEQTELTVRVTDEQARAADNLQDAYETLKLRSDDLANTVAAALVPAFAKLLKVFSDTTEGADGFGKTLKYLAADGSLGIWAYNAAIAVTSFAEALIVLGRSAQAVSSSLVVVANDIALVATVARIGRGDLQAALDLGPLLAKRNKDLESSNEVWAKLWAGRFRTVSDSLRAQREDMEATRVAFQKTLALHADAVRNFAANADARDLRLRVQSPTPSRVDTSGITDGAKAKVSEFAQAMQNLAKQAAIAEAEIAAVFSGDKLTAAKKYLSEIQTSTAWKTMSAAQKQAVAGQAEFVAGLQEASAGLTKFVALRKELDAIGSDSNADLAEKMETLNTALTSGIILLEEYRRLAEKLLSQQPWAKKEAEALQAYIKLEQQAIDEMRKLQEQAVQALGSFADQTIRLENENKLIGLSEEARARILVLLDAQATKIQLINAGDTEGLRILDEQIARRQAAVEAQIRLNKEQAAIAEQTRAWGDAFKAVADRGAQFIDDFAKNGSSAFKRLWDDFKNWALSALAKIAAQQIIVSIAGSFGGTAGSVASSLFGGAGGGMGGISNLLSLFGGGGAAASSTVGGVYGAGLAGGAAGAFDMFGAAAPYALPAVTTAVGAVGTTASFAGAGAAATGALAAVPVVGWIALAAIAAYSIWSANQKPTPTEGQFQIKPPGTPASDFEDRFLTASRFGNVGFADQGTRQFSGEVAQAFNQTIGGLLDLFAARLDETQNTLLASSLQATQFPHFEGTFSTEDFLKTYGSDILKQVATAAFDVLNPALASVLQGFTGTGEEMTKFIGTLLLVHDATADLDDAVKTNVIAALDGTQATAEKVLAFASILTTFGESITGLGPQLEALDPASIIAFIDALGGAQEAVKGFTFLFQNFTTDADKMGLAQANLNKVWVAAGVTADDLAHAGLTALPQTHEQFMQLFTSLELNTEHGSDLAAMLLNNVAPAFVAVTGTAEAAAAAMLQQVADATQFFNQNFFSGAEQAAQRVNTAWGIVHNAWNENAIQLNALGLDHIPTTNAGFRAMIERIREVHGANSELEQRLITLAPAIFGLNEDIDSLGNTVEQVSQQITLAITDLQEAAGNASSLFSSVLAAIESIVSASGGDLGSKIALRINLVNEQITKYQAAIAAEQQLNPYGPLVVAFQNALLQLVELRNSATTELARFTELTSYYGPAIAEQLVALENTYRQQVILLTGNVAALAALDANFRVAWDGIVNGVAAAANSIESIMERIKAVTDTVPGDLGDELAIKLRFLAAEITKYDALIATTPATSPLIAGFRTLLTSLRETSVQTAAQLARFTVLTAQFDAKRAEDLVNLETWYSAQQLIFAGMPEALSALSDVFAARWDEIVKGIESGVDSTINALKRIQEYLDSLRISDLSPLTPQAKLDFSAAKFNEQLALAQSGDIDALNNITKFADEYLRLARDFFASSPAYTAIFDSITRALEALLQPTSTIQPVGPDVPTPQVPTPQVNSAIAAATPIVTPTIAAPTIATQLADYTPQLTSMADYLSTLVTAAPPNYTPKFDELIAATLAVDSGFERFMTAVEIATPQTLPAPELPTPQPVTTNTALVAALPTGDSKPVSSADIDRLILAYKEENAVLRKENAELITALADANTKDAEQLASATTNAALLAAAVGGR